MTQNPLLVFLRRELRGKLRIYIAWAIGLFLVWLIYRNPRPIGIAIVLSGAGLRAWASGCIEKESRLSQGGPFRFSRNPLYLGSLLMTLGAFYTQGYGLIGWVVTLISMVVYHPLVRSEEKVLREKFGAEFDDYCARVARYVPTPRTFLNLFRRPATATERARVTGFDVATFRRNHGWEPLLVGASVIVAIWVIHAAKEKLGLTPGARVAEISAFHS